MAENHQKKEDEKGIIETIREMCIKSELGYEVSGEYLNVLLKKKGYKSAFPIEEKHTENDYPNKQIRELKKVDP